MTGRWASERIRGQGERALPYLVRGLSSNNPRVREWSGGILSHLALKGIIKEERTPRLIDLLSHSDAHVRANVADALGYIGDEKAVPALIKLLSDSEPVVRSKAAGALGGLKDKRAVPHLINLLSDSDAGVRTSAAGGLGEIGSDEAVGPLIACLNSEPDPYVRANAAGALGKIGSRKAVGSLIACLDEIPMAGLRLKDWRHFQSYVMETLGKITGENFGYPWTAPGAERKEIIQKWLDWWRRIGINMSAESSEETAADADRSKKTADDAD